MCLEVTVRLSPGAKTGVSPERLAHASGLHVQKYHDELGPCLHFSGSGACSCDLLARGQNQEGDTWHLDPAKLEGLARVLAFLGKEKIGFQFRVHWLSEERHDPVRIKLASLLEVVRRNEIPRNAAYVVGSYG